MSPTWIPVDNNLVQHLAKTDHPLATEVENLIDKRVNLGDDKVNLSEFKVYQRQSRKSVSNSISVSPFFKGDGSYEDFRFRYFAGAFSDTYRYTQGLNSSIIAERYGMGIEIDLSVSNIETSIKGGFGSIAAAVEMGIANAEYKYHIRAIPPGDFHDLLPPIGKFDSDAIIQLNKLVTQLKTAYASVGDDFDLVAIEVLIAKSVEEEGTENAASYYFAAKKIIQKLSLEQAVKEARGSGQVYNEDAIQYMYSRAGVVSLEAQPSSRNVEIARKLIFE